MCIGRSTVEGRGQFKLAMVWEIGKQLLSTYLPADAQEDDSIELEKILQEALKKHNNID